MRSRLPTLPYQPDLRRAQQIVLELMAIPAKSGEEALELCAARKFDVVVTDYKMARMNGIELIQKIRNSDSQVRIIMLSGFVEPLGV